MPSSGYLLVVLDTRFQQMYQHQLSSTAIRRLDIAFSTQKIARNCERSSEMEILDIILEIMFLTISIFIRQYIYQQRIYIYIYIYIYNIYR